MLSKIAITGKGGVGKTTLCALIIKWLASNGRAPILAVDGDPNSNLNQSLGIELKDTVGNIRESMKAKTKTPSVSSQTEFVEYKINTSLVETEDYDLIAMGRPEGPGCYCYPNRILKETIKKLAANYACFVMDNEAGLENLARRVVQEMDLLLIVSDPTVKGIITAGRIVRDVKSLEIKTKKVGLVLNRLNSLELSPRLKEEISKQKLELVGQIPADEEIYRRDEQGLPTYEISKEAGVYQAVDRMLQSLSK